MRYCISGSKFWIKWPKLMFVHDFQKSLSFSRNSSCGTKDSYICWKHIIVELWFGLATSYTLHPFELWVYHSQWGKKSKLTTHRVRVKLKVIVTNGYLCTPLNFRTFEPETHYRVQLNDIPRKIHMQIYCIRKQGPTCKIEKWRIT